MEQFLKMIIITAPSGSGKTSITKYLLKIFTNLEFCVSVTTRKQRHNEINCKDYYFLPLENFQKKIKNNEFIEWEMVYEGKFYGTLKSELNRIWSNNKTPLLDVDVKGAIHIREQFPSSSLSIFIEPPSLQELKKRLNTRGTETEESLYTRLNKATYELSFKDHFDKVIVNDDLEKACKEAEMIVRSFIEG